MIAVLFTGGLDSTYLLYKALQSGETVTPVYVTLKNNSRKSEIEIEQAKEIISQFNIYFDHKCHDLRILAEIELPYPQHHFPLVQIPIWIFAAQFVQYPYTEIQIGYVMNDCAVSYINEIQNLYKAFAPLYNNDRTNQQVPLTFPILKTDKHEIINNLPDYVKHLVYSCEAPTIDNHACGNCASCKRYIFLHKQEDLYSLRNYKKLFHKDYFIDNESNSAAGVQRLKHFTTITASSELMESAEKTNESDCVLSITQTETDQNNWKIIDNGDIIPTC